MSSLVPPLPLTHSWPLFEADSRFGLGCLLGAAPAAATWAAFDTDEMVERGIGMWQCDLRTDTLTWSAAVYDLFGLTRDAVLDRPDIVSLYAEESRAAMEALRTHAIKNRRGFTLDAEIRPANGPRRRMRLIASPVCDGDRVVRLYGLKRDLSRIC